MKVCCLIQLTDENTETMWNPSLNSNLWRFIYRDAGGCSISHQNPFIYADGSNFLWHYHRTQGRRSFINISFWTISAMEAAQTKLAHSSCRANSAIATTFGSSPAHSSLPPGCFLRRLVATPTLFCSPPKRCLQATVRCVVFGDFLAFCPLRAELWVVAELWEVGFEFFGFWVLGFL